jgi:hypothetical protein
MKIGKKEHTRMHNNLSNYRESVSKRRFKKKRFVYKSIKRRLFIRGSKLVLGTLSKNLVHAKLSRCMVANLDFSFKYGDIFVNYGSSSIKVKGAKSSLKLDLVNPVDVGRG